MSTFRSSVAIAVLGILSVSVHALLAADDERVTKEDLSGAEANAEIQLQADRGLWIRELKVKSDGKEPKFGLVFSKGGNETGRFSLGLNHKDLDREFAMAAQRGGVRFTQLKGYVLNGNVLFAFVTEIDGPPGSGIRHKILRDIPAANFNQIVERERAAGGKLVDESTYSPPKSGAFHTAVFHPR
ncbi:MAG: hypothetical protein AABP62_27665 [Planctomycetota bacterium]